MNCCEHHNLPAGCGEGRDCPSRAPVDLAPLHQADGGHTFHRGVAFPIDSDDLRPLEDDVPLTDPNSVGLGALVLIAASAIVIVVGVASAWAKWMPRLPALPL